MVWRGVCRGSDKHHHVTNDHMPFKSCALGFVFIKLLRSCNTAADALSNFVSSSSVSLPSADLQRSRPLSQVL